MLFFLQRELQSICQKTLDDKTRDFNFDRFSAKEDSIEKIIDACQLLPMMSESRLVIVRDGEKMKKDSLNKWADYFTNPSPTTKLVLVASKIDKRLKTWSQANKKGWIVDLKPPYPNQIPQWISREAQGMGLQITSEAAYALSESLGTLLMAQVQALEKLQLFIMPRQKIELADVEEIVGSFVSKTVFDFTEKVGERNYQKATYLLDQMASQGEPFVRLMFMIARHFRLLLMAQVGINKRIPDRDLASTLGVHPFFLKDYLVQAKKISSQKLQKIYKHLLVADRALKGSPLNPRHVVDRFLMQACLGS